MSGMTFLDCSKSAVCTTVTWPTDDCVIDLLFPLTGGSSAKSTYSFDHQLLRDGRKACAQRDQELNQLLKFASPPGFPLVFASSASLGMYSTGKNWNPACTSAPCTPLAKIGTPHALLHPAILGQLYPVVFQISQPHFW